VANVNYELPFNFEVPITHEKPKSTIDSLLQIRQEFNKKLQEATESGDQSKSKRYGRLIKV
jgi:hypothetical protein